MMDTLWVELQLVMSHSNVGSGNFSPLTRAENALTAGPSLKPLSIFFFAISPTFWNIFDNYLTNI